MTEKILFVDDDELILGGYRRMLSRHFVLETAVGGDQALDRIATGGPYAVIVSNMRMPGMDGLQLLHQSRNAQRSNSQGMHPI